jgi:RNA polymerase sigma-70 factor (ECF subfamily)
MRSLVDRLKSGEFSSYEALFNTFYIPLTSFAHRLVKDAEISKDIVQNVFIKIHQHRESLVVQSDFRSYLYKAVYNESLNELAKINNREKREFVYLQEAEAFHYAEAENEKAYKIYQAIDKLPVKCRKIFLMSRIHGQKNNEIAVELGLSIRTVETQISLALKSIRRNVRKVYLFLLSIKKKVSSHTCFFFRLCLNRKMA